MIDKIKEIGKQIQNLVDSSNSFDELNDIKNKYLGKKGVLSEYMKGLKDVDVETKKVIGKTLNEVRDAAMHAYESKKTIIENIALEKRLKEETIDISLNGFNIPVGGYHPLTITTNKLVDFFVTMGYRVGDGPEIESDLYNFEMLNVSKDHPAREMQDTFYFNENMLLRSHTSPVQIREMLKMNGVGPIKLVCPGKVYRRDEDATHSHQFMQMECLVVDENISFADLKGTLISFIQGIFGDDVKMRLRPSYFPFTEPSVEVDMTCSCKGNDEKCPICKGSGWLEILGAGMVHPNVLKASGFDPEKYSGYALGVGIERVCMLLNGVLDIRNFYTNDLRFLKQFKRWG